MYFISSTNSINTTLFVSPYRLVWKTFHIVIGCSNGQTCLEGRLKWCYVISSYYLLGVLASIHTVSNGKRCRTLWPPYVTQSLSFIYINLSTEKTRHLLVKLYAYFRFAFQYNPALQPRAIIVFGCISKSVTDSEAKQLLKIMMKVRDIFVSIYILLYFSHHI